MENKKVRVRFAPSPTGPLHIGGVRTALYNYLFAKKNNGDFILRIEDTDSSRFVPGAEEYIIKSLKWCGIEFDEGVSEGGPYSPYRQSERKEIYLKYAQELVNNNYAYYAFDTSEELDSIRKEYESRGQTFNYNYQVRTKLKTSLNPQYANYEELIKNGANWVIRFKIPENTTIKMFDLIRGEIEVNSSTLDDKVLFKSSDMLPTYHLANIVDDHLMKITHVIRGEEWLPSLPLHILLYKSFGWEKEMPQFAHLPLLLKPDGKGKLSKRDGDRLGFPVFPLHWTDPTTAEEIKGYDDYGFLPEAFINFLALLGWNPGTEQEIFSKEELIQVFSLDRISKSGAKFDFDKARWFNQQYIMKKSNSQLADLFHTYIKENNIYASREYLEKVCSVIKERIVLLTDFWNQASFFFVDPNEYDNDSVKKKWKEPAISTVKEIKDKLICINNFSAEVIKDIIHKYADEKNINLGLIMPALRISIVGGLFGPDLTTIMEMIGKEATIRRIDKAILTINVN